MTDQIREQMAGKTVGKRREIKTNKPEEVKNHLQPMFQNLTSSSSLLSQRKLTCLALASI